jgi:hypothetical protein
MAALYHAPDTARNPEAAPAPGTGGKDGVLDLRASGWRARFAEVERDLTGLIGGGPGVNVAGRAAGSGTPHIEAAGTGLKDLDPAARKLLQQFRRELELFFAASMGETATPR